MLKEGVLGRRMEETPRRAGRCLPHATGLLPATRRGHAALPFPSLPCARGPWPASPPGLPSRPLSLWPPGLPSPWHPAPPSQAWPSIATSARTGFLSRDHVACPSLGRIPHGQLDKVRVIAERISTAVGIPFGLHGEGQERKRRAAQSSSQRCWPAPGPAGPLSLFACNVAAATVTPSATREPGLWEMGSFPMAAVGEGLRHAVATWAGRSVGDGARRKERVLIPKLGPGSATAPGRGALHGGFPSPLCPS